MDRYRFGLAACAAFGLDAGLLEPVTTASLRQRAPRPLDAGLRIDRLQALLGPECMRHPTDALAAYAQATERVQAAPPPRLP
jgi:dTDP-4-dehydrorhamnose reductase